MFVAGRQLAQKVAELNTTMRRLAYENSSYELPIAFFFDIFAVLPLWGCEYLWHAMVMAGTSSGAVSCFVADDRSGEGAAPLQGNALGSARDPLRFALAMDPIFLRLGAAMPRCHPAK